MTSARFAKLMSGDSDSLDLDEASLVMSAVLQPGLDEIEWLAALDLIAGDCPTATPEGVSRYLFDAMGFAGNKDAYYDWRNSCLDRVMETRTGIPISLSILMIEVGRRVGVKLVGVGMPAHFLVRSADDDTTFFDPFNGGRQLDRDDARALFETITRGQAPWSDSHLDPTPNRAIVIRMLNNLKSVFARRSDEVRFALVMQLRAQLSELAVLEADEFASANAIFN
ncbi:SirB1 family protein [uncultured Ilumatobacter sp.]|uniref:SirB1 family protein n=1 Tax=uncultured Ilumatobacter sp. TaxID=879968 RepID=UPI00374FAC71